MKFLLGLVIFMILDPLTLVLLFIFVLVLASIFLVFIINSFFYSFMLFMLFMSGVVVLLAYMCGVVIIEKVTKSYKFYLNFSWIIILVILFNQIIKLDFIYVPIFVSTFNINYYEFQFIFKFLSFPFNVFSFFLIFYLLVCLVIIYEIIKKCGGPLRMKI